MKVKHLQAALELGNPEDEVFIQTNLKDGYFSLRGIEATQPDGHVGASGFVIHSRKLQDHAEQATDQEQK